MKDHEPKRLPDDVIVEKFIPDPNLSWVASFAGPCTDPECDVDHTRLYLIPIIGWNQVAIPFDGNDDDFEYELRPATMGPSGVVADYLDMPDEFQFIAVLRSGEKASEFATEIYRARFGDQANLVTEDRPTTVVN